MTSKHLFFNAMKEDLRHKTWMTALSILGNFLLVMVAWLVWRSNYMKDYGSVKGLLLQEERTILAVAEGVLDFFGSYLAIGGGLYCIAGAFFAGMLSFRYLFHKNMVDTYHALPVKKHTLFGVCYANGILIWLVPFSVFLLPVLLMGCSLVTQLGHGELVSVLLANTGLTFLTLTIVYLLVYHLVLASVMLSGNVLNTLVSAMILGTGVITALFLCVTFFEVYMDTFYAAALDGTAAVYASPLIFAFFLVFQREKYMAGSPELWEGIGAGLAVAAVLVAAVWLLYRGRASETAEQGIRKPAVSAVFRMIVGVAAGMCGWLFFVFLTTDYEAEGWGIFGVVLGAVLVYGILDVIFRMDFKAFFSHKIQMALTVALSLLVCFLFCRDWFAYDTYLPDQEDIEEIAVYSASLSGSYYDYSTSRTRILENMHLRDKEKLYAFLETMVEHEREGTEDEPSEHITTRVTMKNGRSYFRSYRMTGEDKDLILSIVTEEEYLKHSCQIEEDTLAGDVDFTLYTAENTYYTYYGEKNPKNIMEQVVRAYNRDVLENPESVLLRQGRLLAKIEFELWYRDNVRNARGNGFMLNVYDTMTHTVAALEEAGYRITDVAASDVKAIVLEMNMDPEGLTARDRIDMAREKYGVDEALSGEQDDGEARGGPSAEVNHDQGTETEVIPESAQDIARDTKEAFLSGQFVRITDREEIEEVFGLLSFDLPYGSIGIFGPEYISVDVEMSGTDGETETWFIPRGKLPSKYTERFGEQ